MIMKKILLSVCMCAAVLTANAQFVKNDFLSGYSAGENLQKYAYSLADSAIATRNPQLGQWNLTVKTTEHSDASPVISTEKLTYDGYIDSGKEFAVNLSKVSGTRVTGYSMIDDNTYSVGAYYTAFLLKPTLVGSGNTGNGQDFFTLDGNTFINNQRGRLFIRRGPNDGSSNRTFSIGLSESSSTPTWDSAEFPVGSTTIIIVMKYDFTGSKVSLFINPDLSKTEAENTPVLSYDVSNGIKESAGIRSLVVKQRSSNEVLLGGIRFSDSWEDVLGQNPTSIEENVADKVIIVSTKYYDLRGVVVSEPVNTKSIYIKKDIYEDGSVEVTKVMR